MLRVGFAIIAPILGMMADNQGISYSFLLLSILIIIFISIAIFKIKAIKKIN